MLNFIKSLLGISKLEEITLNLNSKIEQLEKSNENLRNSLATLPQRIKRVEDFSRSKITARPETIKEEKEEILKMK